MSSREISVGLWDYAATFLPADLEDLGRSNGVSRFRGFKRASDLLRLILAWSQSGWSFRTTAAWAQSSGVSSMTPEALFYRVSHSEAFLSAVMGQMVGYWRKVECPRRVLLVDATVLCGPAADGVDWRVHVLYDPFRAVPCGVEVTDSHGAETFGRHDLRAGDLVIGDRGYGHFRGYCAARQLQADVLVRVEPGQMKLTDMDGQKVHLKTLALEVPEEGGKDFNLVWHGPDGDCWKIRIIGFRTKHGQVCWLATNLMESNLASEEAADLYRIRWQIELLFKRMKTLMDLDELRSREGPTARAFIYAKLINAFLAIRLNECKDFSPSETQPEQLLLEGICSVS